ncbi:MAG: helicase-related protein [Nanoarchaeota archaeon]|nr:helicase-related protein [Nanoarchaeota archaeon]
MELVNFVPRPYQLSIVETCKQKNTLVVLPTGTGKTPIALMLAAHRLAVVPGSKILITAPTKPLCNQHVQSFRQSSTLGEDIAIVNGSVPPEKRRTIWEHARVVIATPQTIESDLKEGRISLQDVSLLCLDECHRSRQKYANTTVVRSYLEQAKSPRILALTASPGSSKERVDEIYKNLAIEAVEIRTEEDEEMKPFVQKKEFIWLPIDLPESIMQVAVPLRKVYKSLLGKLQGFGYNKPVEYINKRDVLLMQKQLQGQVRQGNPAAFYGLSLVAQIIKLDHLIMLLETQSLRAAHGYWQKLLSEETKAARVLTGNSDIQQGLAKVRLLLDAGTVHPKMDCLLSLIRGELEKTPDARMIIFANYRDTVAEITEVLQANNITAIRFVGQADKGIDKGQKQPEQAAILQRFRDKEFSVLTASSVGEEGLDLPEVHAVIFYEPVASELRKVQRAGRTARTREGKIIFLMAKKTMDEAYYWVSLRKEKKMKSLLQGLQKKQETQARLL